MLHPPHWFEGGRVAGQSGNHMPVDVGELVAEEFIVDLPDLIDLRDNLGDQVHFFHQLNPFRGSQMNISVAWRLKTTTVQPGKN